MHFGGDFLRTICKRGKKYVKYQQEFSNETE